MVGLFLFMLTVGWTVAVDSHQEDRVDHLERSIEKVWLDLQFVDYDHRVDLCQLQFREDSVRREGCVLAAYHRYCETSRQCTNYPRGR